MIHKGWCNLGSCINSVLRDYIFAIVVSGSDVYVGGAFTNVNNDGRILYTADYIARCGPTPFISLSKTVTPTVEVPYHGTVTYTLALNYTNALSDTNVVLTDALPDGVSFGGWIEKPSGGDVIRNGPSITWTGMLTANTTFNFTSSATHTEDYEDVITNTAHFSGMQQQGSANATFTVAAVGPACTALTGITLTVPPASSLYVNAEVRLCADLAPDDATKPYTYTVDYGDGASDPVSSSEDPLALSHTWSSLGTHTVTVAAWNCAMTTPVTDTLAVEIEARTVYLPLVMRSAS